MPVSPIDFLLSAEKEFSENGEIHCRNAISRAYYSAYHLALALDTNLPNHGGITQNGGVHEILITKLTNYPLSLSNLSRDLIMKIKSLGYVLRQAKTARHEADYDLAIDIYPEDAEAQIELAKKIHQKIEEIESLLTPNKSVGAP